MPLAGSPVSVQPNNGYFANGNTFSLPATPSVLDRYIFVGTDISPYSILNTSVGGFPYIGWNGYTGTNFMSGATSCSCTLICVAPGVFFVESTNGTSFILS